MSRRAVGMGTAVVGLLMIVGGVVGLGRDDEPGNATLAEPPPSVDVPASAAATLATTASAASTSTTLASTTSSTTSTNLPSTTVTLHPTTTTTATTTATTTVSPTTTTTTSTAAPATATSSTAIEEFIVTYGIATADGDAEFLASTLLPTLHDEFGENLCRSWIEREIVGLTNYALDGDVVGPNERVLTIADSTINVRQYYEALITFTFQGQPFDTVATFAIEAGQVFWIGECR